MAERFSLGKFDVSDIEAFARFSRDYSPLHVDVQYARRTRFREQVVHGVLVFLRGVHTVLNEPKRIIHADIQFRAPVLAGQEVEVISEVQPSTGNMILRFLVGHHTVITSKVKFISDKSNVRSPAAIQKGSPESTTTVAPVDSPEFSSLREEDSYRLDFIPDVHVLVRLLHVTDANPLKLNIECISFLAQCSRFVGMRVPGRYALLLSISMNDPHPQREVPDPIGFSEGYTFKIERVSAATRSLSLEANAEQSRLNARVVAAMLSPPIAPDTDPIGAGSNRLAGKVAVITGGSRGIGAATAKLLGLEGCHVFIQFHRGIDDALEIKKWIQANGGTAELIQGDLTHESGRADFITSLKAQITRLDFLIHCAFTRNRKDVRLTTITLKEFEEQFSIGVYALHVLIQAFEGELRISQGRVIGFSSSYTAQPEKGLIPYITGKSALEGFFRAAAVDYKDWTIRFNVIQPSEVLTDLNSARFTEHPDRPMYWTPADVASRLLKCILDDEQDVLVPFFKST